MRSRFSAYALGFSDYIMGTTHPGSPLYSRHRSAWKKSVNRFSNITTFQGLEILDCKEKKNTASVSFYASLSQRGRDVSFTERSYFERVAGRWLYLNGEMSGGKDLELIPRSELCFLPLRYYGDPILEKRAKPVGSITGDVKALIEALIETMDICGGVGLAAPQVGACSRIFVMREPIEHDRGESDELGDVTVFINPQLSDASEEEWTESEGCLSIPGLEGQVSRPHKVLVTYMDELGKQHSRQVGGWEARVIQHEYDHLNGVLFIDRLSERERGAMVKDLEGIKRFMSSDLPGQYFNEEMSP